jgi:phenylpyruvate tautomerase PptA (4-oxalocrotonate tautomerase family)
MPIVRIESSVPLPLAQREATILALVGALERALEVKPPSEVRLRVADVEPASAAVGHAIAGAANPWVVVFAQILEGRSDALIESFLATFTNDVARAYGVDAKHVRILVEPWDKRWWAIGGRSAAASAR